MWKFYMIVMSILLAYACQHATETCIRVQLASLLEEDRKVSVVTRDSTYSLLLDSVGRGMMTLPGGIVAGYADFRYHGMTIPLYVRNGEGFGIFLKVEDWCPVPEFTGLGAPKNQYLNSEMLKGFYPDFKMGEEAFLNSLKEQEAGLLTILDSMEFDPAFTRLEKKRIHYLVYSYLPRYPAYRIHRMEDREYKPTAVFYKQLQDAIPEEGQLLEMREYQDALVNLVNAAGMHRLDGPDEWKYLENQFRFIEKYIKNQDIKDFLTDKFATRYVVAHATDHLDEIVCFYHTHVKSPGKRQKFDDLCRRWLKLTKGQPSPVFRCRDMDGKEVCLADFRGKYVYIDVWATWCMPCRGELPHLEQLARKMKDGNICFVSLSCDRDEEAWKKMVRKEKLGGIQLYGGNKDRFTEAYVVRSIPRFILVDPQGNIISADMTRPSDPQTAAVLETLDGIWPEDL